MMPFRSKVIQRLREVRLLRSFSSVLEPDALDKPMLALKDAWPLLRQRFDASVNDAGDFLLHTKSQESIFSAKFKWEQETSPREAAVLVILCSVKGSPSIIFTRRAAALQAHSSEISFPGGHFEGEVDASLIDTALRETIEEIVPPEGMLDSPNLEVLGKTTRLPALKGTPVTPVIAMLRQDLLDPVSNTFPGDPDEVELVFSVTIQDLLSQETNHVLPNNRFGLKEAPLFPTTHGEIWGLTAFILRPLLHRLIRPVFYDRTTA